MHLLNFADGDVTGIQARAPFYRQIGRGFVSAADVVILDAEETDAEGNI